MCNGSDCVIFGLFSNDVGSELKWCQITNGDRTYTCPTKYINGELFFRFKNEWHKGAEFVSNHAEELVEEGGKIFSQSFKH